MFAQDIQNNKVKGNGYNFIDLFAGAGGLSEGFFQAGFNPIAHVEMNPYAAQTLETRSCYYYLKKSTIWTSTMITCVEIFPEKILYARFPKKY